jgi:predicted MarR family transcription regulator
MTGHNGSSTREPELIVSSAHLAAGNSPALSELEYGLILASHAFTRWMVRCMAAVGVANLSATEILILNTVRHRDRPKRLADICLVLDIDDTHVVTYALRKLEAAGLVTTGRAGKEKTVQVTKKGVSALVRYQEIRERLLVNTTMVSGVSQETLSAIAAQLRALSGYYEQAARAAATL